MEKTKQMLGFNKRFKGILEAASKDPGRYNLQKIKIYPDGKAEATDGHLLLQVPLTKMDLEEIPENLAQKHGPIEEPITISRDAIEKALKNAPKRSSLPALDYVYINKSNGEISLASTDLDTVQETVEKDNGNDWPDTSVIWPTKKPFFEIALQARLLGNIAKAASQLSADGCVKIKFAFRSRTDAVAFTFSTGNGQGEKVKGVLMPMRFED